MSEFVNFGEKRRLIDVLDGAVRSSLASRKRYQLHLLSCYFDVDAAQELVRAVAMCLREKAALLGRVVMAVDAADWLRQRIDLPSMVSALAEACDDPRSQILFVPINVPGRLIHAKGYSVTRSSPLGEVGFVATTSGNLTRRGLGIHEERSNVELVQLSHEPSQVQSFVNTVEQLVSEYPFDDTRIKQQDDFLLGLKLFARGGFYRNWTRSLGSEVLFRFNLTEKGKDESRRGLETTAFRTYAKDTNSFSVDPLGLASLFEEAAKPLWPHFWKTCSVDTLLGNWVPPGVDELVCRLRGRSLDPYLDAIAARTSQERVADAFRKLEADVNRFGRKDLDLVKNSGESLEAWLEKVHRLRSDKEAVERLVFDRQRVPDPLHGREIVLALMAELRSRFLRARRHDRTSSALAKLIEGGGQYMDAVYDELAQKAQAEHLRWIVGNLRIPLDEEIRVAVSSINEHFDVTPP